MLVALMPSLARWSMLLRMLGVSAQDDEASLSTSALQEPATASLLHARRLHAQRPRQLCQTYLVTEAQCGCSACVRTQRCCAAPCPQQQQQHLWSSRAAQSRSSSTCGGPVVLATQRRSSWRWPNIAQPRVESVCRSVRQISAWPRRRSGPGSAPRQCQLPACVCALRRSCPQMTSRPSVLHCRPRCQRLRRQRDSGGHGR
mmetsp:Transcript_63161/g.175131  ORF Transcript_63161/g.175131 Transcript_63161/m.175131 type:complete len:201 (+) Transcript_63161:2813-3415(+)